MATEEDEEEKRTFEVDSKFKEFVHWNLDKKPSENDKIQQSFEWLEVAKAVR